MKQRKRSISKPTTMTLLENQSAQRNSNQDLGVIAPKIEEPRPVNNYVTSGVMYASPTADYINSGADSWNQDMPIRSKTTLKQFYNTNKEFASLTQ